MLPSCLGIILFVLTLNKVCYKSKVHCLFVWEERLLIKFLLDKWQTVRTWGTFETNQQWIRTYPCSRKKLVKNQKPADHEVLDVLSCRLVTSELLRINSRKMCRQGTCHLIKNPLIWFIAVKVIEKGLEICRVESHPNTHTHSTYTQHVHTYMNCFIWWRTHSYSLMLCFSVTHTDTQNPFSLFLRTIAVQRGETARGKAFILAE